MPRQIDVRCMVPGCDDGAEVLAAFVGGTARLAERLQVLCARHAKEAREEKDGQGWLPVAYRQRVFGIAFLRLVDHELLSLGEPGLTVSGLEMVSLDERPRPAGKTGASAREKGRRRIRRGEAGT